MASGRYRSRFCNESCLGKGRPSCGVIANSISSAIFLGMSVWARCRSSGTLSEGYLPTFAFFLLDIAADFQQAVEHFGALRAAGGKLGICLLMRLLEAV